MACPAKVTSGLGHLMCGNRSVHNLQMFCRPLIVAQGQLHSLLGNSSYKTAILSVRIIICIDNACCKSIKLIVYMHVPSYCQMMGATLDRHVWMLVCGLARVWRAALCSFEWMLWCCWFVETTRRCEEFFWCCHEYGLRDRSADNSVWQPSLGGCQCHGESCMYFYKGDAHGACMLLPFFVS